MEPEEKKDDKKTWLKRLGIAGILFFVIKGTISLTLILFAGSKFFESCN